MSGVVFVITIPTANHEAYLKSDRRFDLVPSAPLSADHFQRGPPPPPPPRMEVEVELRNKYAIAATKKRFCPNSTINNAITTPLEKILEDLLKKLELDRVTWCLDKQGRFYQVIFPTGSGDPCETTLHCLTQLGIGVKYQSNVSVIPCSVVYDGQERKDTDYDDWTPEQQTKWDKFVDSIRSKLTVKQVVDGVRAGGSLSFDYILLIVTADSLAALGLVENNAPNIVAAMLVSPLMGPVMAVTFGAMIADKDLVKSGFIAFSVGLLTSLAFGFFFGLILGTTQMPWGFGDWPTEEMKGRGNYRSLWMGVLWALTSGTGVAVALLVGSVGPLIGVAISASLLPPLVNCGLYWALACIWLIYDGVKIPHIKGEPYTGNSTYQFIYTDYVPTEFFISGIMSGLLTIVNVICIFITAIIVLKIKEVASPYTSSPDLRRFWEKDIREVRKTNRSTMRKKPFASGLSNLARSPHNENMDVMFEKAVQEATDNSTFRAVKRMSYANNSSEGTSLFSGNRKNPESPSTTPSPANLPSDSAAIDKLVSTLIQRLETSKAEKDSLGSFQGTRSRSIQFKRVGSTHGASVKRFKTKDGDFAETSFIESGNGGNGSSSGGMPTIKEQQSPKTETPPSTLTSGMRNAFHSISDASHRLSQTISSSIGATASTSTGEETANLTDNQEENALDN